MQNELGTTTIYVTHDQVEAMTMGDRVAVMRKGELQQVATPQEVYDHPVNLFVGGFIGSPSMNILEAEIEETGGRGLCASWATSAWPSAPALVESRPAERRVRRRPVVVGIRPEGLEDTALVPRRRPTGGYAAP